jgi:hypothetical protein
MGGSKFWPYFTASHKDAVQRHHRQLLPQLAMKYAFKIKEGNLKLGLINNN